MAAAERIVIPRCIGCGAMHEVERCEHGCREEHRELVAAGDLDAVDQLERSAQERIRAVLPVLRALADPIPAEGEWEAEYGALAAAARRALRDAATGPAPARAPSDLPEPQRIAVWRCAVCGAVDAPQECIGICIWRRFEWVSAAAYELSRTEVERTSRRERQIFGLLGRIAFSTPHADAWRRSWRALNAEARELLNDRATEPAEAHV